MRNKILEKFNDKNIAINVKTQVEYDSLMKYLEKQVFRWVNGDLPTEAKTTFDNFKERTCIRICEGTLTFGSIVLYTEDNYKIISYQDFMDEMGANKAILIIDLINAIANGEEQPKKIKFGEKIWTWNGSDYEDMSLNSLWLDSNKKYLFGCYNFKILNKYAEIIEEPVLDEKEKEYLSYVIKPFRDKVENIFKSQVWCSTQFMEYIVIEWYGGGIEFPEFEKGTMYKNMELDRGYTLEELGL